MSVDDEGDAAPAERTRVDEAADAVRRLTGVECHQVALVLGSGWAPVADALGTMRATVDYAQIPGLARPSARGHVPRLCSLDCQGVSVLAFLGRTHLYEGLGMAAAVRAVRVAAAAGCRAVVLTNAAGGIDPAMASGTPVLISDHLNLTGESPLVGPQFVDLTDLYAQRLRMLCAQAMPGIGEAVYAQFRGPQYETPAEVEMARRMGAGLVGMSTAVEAVTARAAGLQVLGVSLVTNPAAGVTGLRLDHQEVLANAVAATPQLGALLAAVVPAIADAAGAAR